MSYTRPPPEYGATESSASAGTHKAADQEPLLQHNNDNSNEDHPVKPSAHAAQAQAQAQSSAMRAPPAWQGDSSMADDFDVGVTVSQSSQEIRNAFIRKVYSMLFFMIASTTAVGALMRTQSIQTFMQANAWFPITCMLGSFAALLATMWKRHSHPANLFLLGAFTACEAVTVGSAVSYFDQTLVLKALLVTAFIFVGLSLFTFQSRYDFSGLAPFLFTGLMGMLGMGLVGLFVGWGKTTELVYSGFGVLLFSGYILYDTSMIMNRLSPDEWVMAVISLYLDALNVFLYVLRILSSSQDN